MGVLIDNRQKKHRISQKTISKKAQVILNASDNPDAELSILLVDDLEIENLNQQYLSRQGPTNVIAFPMQEGEFVGISPLLLGDVVISLDTAEREGRLAGISMESRLDQLLIHGILHLFGYDHEKNSDDARRMEYKSNELLNLIEDIK